jgi:M6 family metalloprotease-like protein
LNGGSYVSLEISLRKGSGLKLTDLEYYLPEGIAAGIVTTAPENFQRKLKPAIQLNVGHKVGEHELIVRKVGTSIVLSKTKFVIANNIEANRAGFGQWYRGIPRGIQAFGAWGGGPSSAPQNLSLAPVTGTKNIAIILVDTTSARYPAAQSDIDAIRDRWKNSVDDGVGPAGSLQSTARYFREASHNLLDIKAEVYGPFHLAGKWNSYFYMSNGLWVPNGNLATEAIAMADPSVDFAKSPHLLFVVPDVPAMPGSPTATPRLFAWPSTWDSIIATDEDDPLGGGEVHFGMTSMSADWGELVSNEPNREIFETYAHEYGHVSGMADQYAFDGEDPGTAARHIENWDLMHQDSNFPFFSVFHRLALGWYDPSWIKRYNFSAGSVPAPSGDLVTLSPTENVPPAVGTFGAIEVRIADGQNYYFEYRSGQMAQIGDRNLDADQRVLGTDTLSYGYLDPPIRRRQVLRVQALADGAVLAPGQHYEEKDPTAPAKLNVEVVSADASKAVVRIKYGVNGRADPSIRPWPASTQHPYQSPDIEVRNARNGNGDVNSPWFNVPWAGHENTVVAKVTNRGDRDAPGVSVNFSVKNFNVGGVPEFPLSGATQDVPAGQTKEFSTTWFPSDAGHFCIVARVPLYQEPTTQMVEMTELNNEAQSNYDRFISSTASPATRELSTLEVRNPFDGEAMVRIIPTQTNPLYFTYVSPEWVLLKPHQTQRIAIAFEYGADSLKKQAAMSGNATYNTQMNGIIERYSKLPNQIVMRATITDPRVKNHYSIVNLGGAEVQVATARRTSFRRFALSGSTVTGLVVTDDDNRTAPAGKVILTVRRPDGKLQDASFDVTSGSFEHNYQRNWSTIEAYYMPSVKSISDANSPLLAIPK